MRSKPTMCVLPAAALLGACLLLGACRDESTRPGYQLDVEVQHDPDVVLSGYSSFEVVAPTTMVDEPPPAAFAELEPEIVAAITDELIGKGLVADDAKPELLVHPLVTINEVGDSLDFYDAHWGWYWGYPYAWAVDEDLPRGSLVIEVVDQRPGPSPFDDRLIYRGSVRGLLAEDVEVIRAELREAMQAMFAEWPQRPEPKT